METVLEKVLQKEGSESGTRVPSAAVEPQNAVEGLTLAHLSAKWNGVVKALKGQGVNVVNPCHALEGALSIR